MSEDKPDSCQRQLPFMKLPGTNPLEEPPLPPAGSTEELAQYIDRLIGCCDTLLYMWSRWPKRWRPCDYETEDQTEVRIETERSDRRQLRSEWKRVQHTVKAITPSFVRIGRSTDDLLRFVNAVDLADTGTGRAGELWPDLKVSLQRLAIELRQSQTEMKQWPNGCGYRRTTGTSVAADDLIRFRNCALDCLSTYEMMSVWAFPPHSVVKPLNESMSKGLFITLHGAMTDLDAGLRNATATAALDIGRAHAGLGQAVIGDERFGTYHEAMDYYARSMLDTLVDHESEMQPAWAAPLTDYHFGCAKEQFNWARHTEGMLQRISDLPRLDYEVFETNIRRECALAIDWLRSNGAERSASIAAVGGEPKADKAASEANMADLSEGEWLMPPISKAEMARRMGKDWTVDRIEKVFVCYGLRQHGTRQQWTVRLDKMPKGDRRKLEKES